MNWKKVSEVLPEEGKVVMTKIDDEDGERNVQKLIRKKGLWFFSDMRMYVYYTPTHWSEI